MNNNNIKQYESVIAVIVIPMTCDKSRDCVLFF